MKPQHFDIIGTLAFTFIAGFAIYALQTDHGSIPTWSLNLLALIGIGGLFIDLTIVYVYFGRKK